METHHDQDVQETIQCPVKEKAPQCCRGHDRAHHCFAAKSQYIRGAAETPSKQLQLAALVARDEGATLEQMVAATGWLPHTTRAALTRLKKKGYVISSDKVDGVRTYRAVAPE